MKSLYGVYGASGCGRGVMPLLRAERGKGESRLVFIDDAPQADAANGHAIWTFARFMDEPAATRAVVLAIANPRVRETLDQRCAEAEVALIGTTAANVVMMDDVEVGPGAVLSPFVTLTSNIRIGRCFHANLYSYIEHDCLIGDYVTFAPGVRCNGNVTIGDHAYVGSGAIIRQGVSVGAGATIGMGAVVTKDVPAGATVIGNPARIMEKK
ncbi:acetyltransferase [Sphingopyxis chilensis]|uniref:acetyltransferase n=1 Tax=Sphingopyxis chilensis TaxID=180400 RepID=UPI002DDCF454|nr:acetyltransferase [Sphingopyxis chilensis]